MSVSERKAVLQRRLSRKFQVSLVFEGACVGLVTGAVVCLYRLSLHQAEHFLNLATAFVKANWAFLPLWVAALIAIWFIVSRLMLWEPYTVGSGIPQIDAEVAGKVDMPWYRVMFAKFIEGALCTLAGLSLGREGPSVQLGGMSGKAVSKVLHKARGEERILITCGAGAGMAAAFHAPLTGVMFTLEEIHKVFTAPLIISVMVSSAAADFLVAQILGVQPVLSLKFVLDLPHDTYPIIIIMGIVLGGLGAAHNKGMFAAQSWYSKITKKLPYARLAIPFFIAGFVVFLAPDLVCGGDAIVEYLEGFSPKPIEFLILLLLGKYLFTTISFGSGAPGGTLFPLVVMGLLAGSIFGNIAVSTTGLNPIYITNFMVLGIAGLFAGVVRAPMTGIMLAFELTGTLDSMLAAALVAIISYVTANTCGVAPFYEKLLADFLGRKGDEDLCTVGHEKILHSHIVEAGSMIEGKLIENVNWPESMLVVTIDRCGVEIIPKGTTRLQAMDTLLCLMDLDAEEKCEKKLRSLCRGNIERR